MNIKIIPKKLCGSVEAPASKSYAHRHIAAAMLSDGVTRIEINALSDDILCTLSCVKSLGGDFTSDGNTVTATPILGRVKKEPVLDCGESGTTARIMLPVCAACAEGAMLEGRGRLPERPFTQMVRSLSEHGCSFSSDKLPIKVTGKMTAGNYKIEGNVSSQFITGLMYALPLLDGDSEITLTTPLQSSAYVDMTMSVLGEYGVRTEKTERGFYVKSGGYRTPGSVFVEGDWSGAAFWIAADKLGADISVSGLKSDSAQGDRRICDVLDDTVIDVSEIPDLFPVLSVLAAGRKGKTVLCGAGRLRIKESDRITSACEMIKSLGGDAREGVDFLEIYGTGKLLGGCVDSFGDHRIAMSAAVASLICDSPVTINGAEAVSKSYPSFFREFERLGGEVYAV